MRLWIEEEDDPEATMTSKLKHVPEVVHSVISREQLKESTVEDHRVQLCQCNPTE